MEARGPRRGFFDVWSLFYDTRWVQRSTYRPVHDAVRRALGDPLPRRILDLGCGTGQLAARLAREGPHVTVVGCDFSGGMLARAARRRPRLPLVQADAEHLPFAGGTFDAIVCTEAFHWFPDQHRALAECRRVLRPGGRLLIAVMNTPAPAVSQAFELVSRLLGEPFYWPTRDETRRWLTEVGFRVTGEERIARFGASLLSPTLTEAVRPLRSSRRPRRAAPAARRRHRQTGRGRRSAR